MIAVRMFVPLMILVAPTVLAAPAPFNPTRIVVGELTGVGEGGDRLWITIKGKEYQIPKTALLFSAAKKPIRRDQVVGMFMLYGLGDSSIRAEIVLVRDRVVSVRFASYERIKVMPRQGD